MFKSLMTNIMVESVDETVDFYINKLSFDIVTSVPKEKNSLVFAILKKDNTIISFQEKDNIISEYETLKTDFIKPTFTLFFTVDNIDEIYKELKDKVLIAKNMHNTFYGTKEFAIFDNNGNILTISEQENKN